MAGKPVLSQQQAELFGAEKQFFGHLQQVVEAFGAAPQDRDLLAKVSAGLDQLFLLVVVGEFNSGKSSFINALIGERVLPEGVTPTTSQVNLLRFGPQPSRRPYPKEPEMVEVIHPAAFLQEISIVDTPGTNAVIERHQLLTEEFVPRSDMVLFVTSAERPFTQSERQFLEKVRTWGKKIIVVINKVDLLANQEDYNQVVRFVASGFRQLLGLEPPIFPVSGRRALQAKTQPGPQATQMWQASGYGPLEDYIFRTLDEASRLRLKFLSPLAVAERLLGQYQTTTAERLNLLEQDARTIDNIERQLENYYEDTRRDFEGRLALVDNLLYELNDRADRFFDDVLKLSHMFELVKTDRIKRDFEQRVVGDTPRRIEQSVQDMVEWMAEREGRIWQDVSGYLQERRQVGDTEGLIGKAGDQSFDQFNANRKALLRQVGEQAYSILQGFDQQAEAEKLNQLVKSAMNRTVLTEIGAIGIGAGLAILLSSAMADFTGLLLTLVVGGIGFYIIPARRRRAKYEFRHKVELLREQLTGVLREQFRNELTLSTERVREALSPYTRFIRSERQRLGQFNTDFKGLSQDLLLLQADIKRVTAGAQVQPDKAQDTPLAPATW